MTRFTFPNLRMRFVRSGRAAINSSQDVVQRIGTAIIGGDFTGNPRGNYALDIQNIRLADDSVASGDESLALGARCKVGGLRAIGIGADAWAFGVESFALGSGVTAQANGSVAIGQCCSASAVGAMAIGPYASADVPHSVNLGGLVVLRNDDDEDDPTLCFGGAEIVLLSHERDLTRVAAETIDFQSRSKFFPRECGLVVTALAGLITQPSVEFGTREQGAAHLPSFPCTELTRVGACERYLPASCDGVTSVRGAVAAPAAATALKGRFFWRGMLVEDE